MNADRLPNGQQPTISRRDGSGRVISATLHWPLGVSVRVSKAHQIRWNGTRMRKGTRRFEKFATAGKKGRDRFVESRCPLVARILWKRLSPSNRNLLTLTWKTGIKRGSCFRLGIFGKEPLSLSLSRFEGSVVRARIGFHEASRWQEEGYTTAVRHKGSIARS